MSCLTFERRGFVVILHLFLPTPIHLLNLPNKCSAKHENIKKLLETVSISRLLAQLPCFLHFCFHSGDSVADVCAIMAIDDNNLHSRTECKLNSYQNDYKSMRRNSLPSELFLRNDLKGKYQRNIRNLEPIHPRRPKKRPPLFPGRTCCFDTFLTFFFGV